MSLYRYDESQWPVVHIGSRVTSPRASIYADCDGPATARSERRSFAEASTKGRRVRILQAGEGSRTRSLTAEPSNPSLRELSGCLPRARAEESEGRAGVPRWALIFPGKSSSRLCGLLLADGRAGVRA